MKKQLFRLITTALIVTLTFSGCFNPPLPELKLTDAPLVAEKCIDFADGKNDDMFFAADGWANGGGFGVVWKDSNVFYENGIMRLGITEEKATAWLGDAEVEFDYTAGEVRTQNYYHYGDYIVKMKPSANKGTASTFFTYTGPCDAKFVLDENGDYVLDGSGQRVTVPNPHDEIDIEFLGKDTTEVQFNYFVNGVGRHEYKYDLGFDASEEFHEYGFRWAPDSITWFVDGEPVYKVTTDKTAEATKNLVIVDALPSSPGRILTNYWCGNKKTEGWMGKYDGDTNDNGAQYQWIATSAVGAPLNPEEKPDIDDPTLKPAPTDPVSGDLTASINGTEVTFWGNVSNGYGVNANDENNTLTVTYTDIVGGSYKNFWADVSAIAGNKNIFSMKVHNPGTAPVKVRIDIESKTKVNETVACNVSSKQDGVEKGADTTYGGSYFEIAPGATANLEVTYDASRTPTNLKIYVDSATYADTTVYAGQIVISEMAFSGEYIPEDSGDDPVVPSEQLRDIYVEFKTDHNYRLVSPDTYANSVRVTYMDIAKNSWSNVNIYVQDKSANCSIFSMKLTNHGTENVSVWVQMKDTNGAALIDENKNIAAGTEETFTFNYTGDAKMIFLFIDSSHKAAEGTHSGDITISDLKLGFVTANDDIVGINHRGWYEAPENTLSAFRESSKHGFKYVECDVQFTKDGIPVLLHDNTIDRTSDGSGEVSQLTYAELLQYDFSYDEDDTTTDFSAYRGEKIPTFAEFIALCKELSLHPYIEIKGTITVEQANTLLQIVTDADMVGNVSWLSSSSDALAKIAATCPTARIVWVIPDVDAAALAATHVPFAEANLMTGQNQVVFDLWYPLAKQDVVDLLKAHNIALEVWTVNATDVILGLHPYVTAVTSDKYNAGQVVANAKAAEEDLAP